MKTIQTYVAALILGSVLTTPAAAQSLVYDNTMNIRSNIVYQFSREYGDEVFLANGNRSISQFVFQYFGDFNPLVRTDGTAKIRFYVNDGVDGIVGPQTALMPKTLLWESDAITLLNGYNIVTLGVPWVQVPDSFTWTVKFSGVTGATKDSAGLVLADPPTVGQPLVNGRFGSYWDAWIKQPSISGDWSLINFGVGPNDPKANFYARIHAVPEPSTWALLVGGGLLLAFSARRRR